MSGSAQSNASKLADEHKLPAAVVPTYLALLDYVRREEFRGACHAVTGILHVLLRSQGVDSRLVTGEIQRERLVFNHSWLELDGKAFDIAISLPLDPSLDGNPVFAGRDLVTLGPPYWNYGFNSGLADDEEVWVIKQRTFVEFMDSAPHHKHGLWHVVQKVGRKTGLTMSLNRLRAAHTEDRWEER